MPAKSSTKSTRLLAISSSVKYSNHLSAQSTRTAFAFAVGFTSSAVIVFEAARAALQTWSNVANINFSEVADTAGDVGDIRFSYSSVLAAEALGKSENPRAILVLGEHLRHQDPQTRRLVGAFLDKSPR